MADATRIAAAHTQAGDTEIDYAPRANDYAFDHERSTVVCSSWAAVSGRRSITPRRHTVYCVAATSGLVRAPLLAEVVDEVEAHLSSRSSMRRAVRVTRASPSPPNNRRFRSWDDAERTALLSVRLRCR
jgi:hypothetical protein